MASLLDRFSTMLSRWGNPLPKRPLNILPDDIREQSHGLRNDLTELQAGARELKKVTTHKDLLDENLEAFFNQLRGNGHKQ